MANAASSLPRWDMAVIYPGLESPEFARDFRRLTEEVAALGALFDARQIGAREPGVADGAAAETLEAALTRLNGALDLARTIGAYVYAFVTTDSRDAVALGRQSEMEQVEARLSQLGTRFAAWVGTLDVEALVRASTVAREHAYPLRRAKAEAAHLMSPTEEALAAELNVTGGAAWGNLWGNVSSQIAVPLERDGVVDELPMTIVRNLASDPDREVRRRAYEAELAAWERWAVPLAAAMNGIKGQVNLLAGRRGWATPLDAALFGNGIDRPILEAMLGAAREAFPTFRRYLKAKARALGLETLAWYDLFAPVAEETSPWGFDRAERFIVAQFGTYSPRLRDLAARAFRDRWIDAEPRAGKRGGAYCMPVRGDESRVLANYQPNLSGVTTLAHELGHAYHNLAIAGRTPLQQETPMVLAETASIFCETIVKHAALRQLGPVERLAVLEESLQGATQVVVDIASRLRFEEDVFGKRAERDLSVAELSELMLQAQRETYGEGLDQARLHPYMWAAKPHYYSADASFYNYPYMFGLLFGLGLYVRFEAEPEAFKAGYDDLLASTGLADPATLAARFGIDVRAPDFWRSSLAVIGADVEEFEQLVGGRAGG